MDALKFYEGKNVFLELKSGRKYSGKVINVDDSTPPLIWITMIDKFGKQVVFIHSEIEVIEEEREE